MSRMILSKLKVIASSRATFNRLINNRNSQQTFGFVFRNKNNNQQEIHVNYYFFI